MQDRRWRHYSMNQRKQKEAVKQNTIERSTEKQIVKNRQKKKFPDIKDVWEKHRRKVTVTGVIFFVGILYLGYLILYRPNVEPGTNAVETTTEPAFYSVKQQMSILRPFEELYRLAFSGRAIEQDYGMIAIPGLEATKTLTENQDGEVEMCTSMTPQGLAVVRDYILVSAYCHTHKHNSVVYVMDKNTHEYIKTIVLMNKDHAGGLAFDKEHNMIWVSTSHDDRAAASAFSLQNMEAYDFDKMETPIPYTYDYDLYTLERDSFMSYGDGYLYIGHFSRSETSVVQKFKIEDNGALKTSSGAEFGIDMDIAIPDDVKKIPKRIQGFAIYEDKVILTQSYGVTRSSLFVYNYSDVMHRTQKKYTLNKITLPQKLEQIYIDGTDVYILFESAAYAYSAHPGPKVDRILKLHLNEVLKVDLEDLVAESDDIAAEDGNEGKASFTALWSRLREILDFCMKKMELIKNKVSLLEMPFRNFFDLV